MTKAIIKLASGTSVTIEGSNEDVQALIRQFEGSRRKSEPTSKMQAWSGQGNKVIKDYVVELKDAGLFKKPQGLSDIKNALQAEGHIVPITTLSGVMLGLVKSRELRRFKEGKTWKYVNR